jgi:hypothetical protein
MASHPHLPPLALMGLSDIMTPALARDVYADVASLTTHSKAHVSYQDDCNLSSHAIFSLISASR